MLCFTSKSVWGSCLSFVTNWIVEECVNPCTAVLMFCFASLFIFNNNMTLSFDSFNPNWTFVANHIIIIYFYFIIIIIYFILFLFFIFFGRYRYWLPTWCRSSSTVGTRRPRRWRSLNSWFGWTCTTYSQQWSRGCIWCKSYILYVEHLLSQVILLCKPEWIGPGVL